VLCAAELVSLVCYYLRISVQALNVDALKCSSACNFVYQTSFVKRYNRSLSTSCRQLPNFPPPPKITFKRNKLRFEYELVEWCSVTNDIPALTLIKKSPWPQSASELYRPSDRLLSEKLVPTLFAEGRCHVVSVTNPYGCNLGFLDRCR
jgi:hypothetical protein